MTKTKHIPEDAQHESRIVWTDVNWASYPYVREKTFLSSRRSGPPAAGVGVERLVGYAELKPTAPMLASGRVWRRMWMLHDSDFKPLMPNGSIPYANEAGLIVDAPTEGMLPESVQPGQCSTKAFQELHVSPRPIPAPSTNNAAKVRRQEPRSTSKTITEQERPSRSYQFSYLLAGEKLQMRAARLDAALRAARQALVDCHSERNCARLGNREPTSTESAQAQIEAVTVVFKKWWSADVAQKLAEADFGVHSEAVKNEQRAKRAAWLRQATNCVT